MDDARKPASDLVGESGAWHLEEPEGLTEVVGDLIAYVATQESRHSGHFERWAPRGAAPCRACRWFEISIIQTPDKFVMYRIGRSQVPREGNMFTPLTMTADAAELVEAAHHFNKRTGAKHLSSPSLEALETAAEFDDGIAAAIKDIIGAEAKVVRRI